jgi:hypothetical protein
MAVFLIFAILVLYLLPSYIAFRRKHKNLAPVMVFNILLGWTGIAWIAALIWSLSYQGKNA